MEPAPREPRDDYTVFSESDFIAGADAGEVLPAPDLSGAAGGRRFGRVAGPALIAGVLGAIVVMLLAHRPLRPAAEHPGASAGAGLRAGGALRARANQPRLQGAAPAGRLHLPRRRAGGAVWSQGRPAAVANHSRSGPASSSEPTQAPGGAAQAAAAPPEAAEFGFER
ncbi:MAG TPA: hypothetical protein VHY83_12905 [Solirubrobacteraceae bacterium]|jgi:hypothetical protein|nr:hypothetical protein [Solirubrobacteraceae bacterium]